MRRRNIANCTWAPKALLLVILFALQTAIAKENVLPSPLASPLENVTIRPSSVSPIIPSFSHPTSPEPLKVSVTLTDTKNSIESPYWPLSPGTAAFLTLVGSSIVALYVFFARTKHEKEMRKIESEADLREKVYLEAAESFAWAMNNFSKLYSSKPDEYFESMKDSRLTASVYKINLVAHDTTLEKIDAFNSTLGRASLELAAGAFSIQFLDQKATRLSKRIEENLANQQRLISRWAEIPETQRTPDLYNAFATNFDKVQKEFYDMDHSRSESWKLIIEKRLSLTKEGLQKLKLVNEALNEAYFAVRDEMDLPLNREAFRKRAATSFDEINLALKKFQEDITKASEEIGI